MCRTAVMKAMVQKKPTTTPSKLTPSAEKDLKIPLNDVKKECEELGFTPGTESFGECVLELM